MIAALVRARTPLRFALVAAALCLPAAARAAEPEACPRLIADGARLQRVAAAEERVRLTFEGHATFLIESPGGVRAATDYNDYIRPPMPLDVVTMNKAHSTHYSENPDPRIGQALRGWGAQGREVSYDVRIRDMRIRNVQTNIRDWGGGTDYLGNSIFVFETAQMCVAHLGHLHHELTEEHLRQLGQIDVLLAPVDGSYTLNMAGMMDVIAKINPRIVVPMHFFGGSTLERFLDLAAARFEVERRSTPELIVSRDDLPGKTRVVVLPGR